CWSQVRSRSVSSQTRVVRLVRSWRIRTKVVVLATPRQHCERITAFLKHQHDGFEALPKTVVEVGLDGCAEAPARLERGVRPCRTHEIEKCLSDGGPQLALCQDGLHPSRRHLRQGSYDFGCGSGDVHLCTAAEDRDKRQCAFHQVSWQPTHER